jgi:hypothetical protein
VADVVGREFTIVCLNQKNVAKLSIHRRRQGNGPAAKVFGKPRRNI